jgi:hypothetical protein
MAETRRNAKYIVTDLIIPESRKIKDQTVYYKYAKRVLWMDDAVIKGAFQMNVSWYHSAYAEPEAKPHTHDADEIIGFFGSDPKNPYELNAELEIWLEDEKYILTKSCLIFVPAGMVHCPLYLRKINRPIFHLTATNAGEYVQTRK